MKIAPSTDRAIFNNIYKLVIGHILNTLSDRVLVS